MFLAIKLHCNFSHGHIRLLREEKQYCQKNWETYSISYLDLTGDPEIPTCSETRVRALQIQENKITSQLLTAAAHM